MKYIKNKNKYLYLKYKLNGGSNETFLTPEELYDFESTKLEVIHNSIILRYYENIDSDTTKILKKINYLMDIINYDYIYVSLGSAIHLINPTSSTYTFEEEYNKSYQIFPSFLRSRNNKKILIIIIDNLHKNPIDISREKEILLSNYLNQEHIIDEEINSEIIFFYNRLDLDIEKRLCSELNESNDRIINRNFFIEFNNLLKSRSFNYNNLIIANFIKFKRVHCNEPVSDYIYDILLHEDFKEYFYDSFIENIYLSNFLYLYKNKKKFYFYLMKMKNMIHLKK